MSPSSARSFAAAADSHWNDRLERVLEQKLSAPEPTSSIESCTIDPNKKTIVVLGSGWGAISFIKALDKKVARDMFNVVVVSPRNYFLYTPLLPGVATGAIETRSIVESIRKPIAEKGFKYYEAAATGVDAQKKTVSFTNRYLTSATASKWLPNVGGGDGEGGKHKSQHFDINYDYLVVAVGAIPNTFGVPGVEQHCLFIAFRSALRVHGSIVVRELVAVDDDAFARRKRLVFAVGIAR